MSHFFLALYNNARNQKANLFLAFLPSSLLWNECFIAYPQIFWASDSTKDQMRMNRGVLQPNTSSECVHCLWCLEKLFSWQWKLFSNTVNMHTGDVGFLEMKGCTRVFSDIEAEELEMSRDMALLPLNTILWTGDQISVFCKFSLWKGQF